MLVTATVTEKKEIKKNIDLPYYSKDSDTFFRINEDESVLMVAIIGKSSSYLGLSKKTTYSSSYYLDRAISAEQCSVEEVEKAVRYHLEFVGAAIELLAESV